ncbi:MAG: hypothetical protein ACJ72B_01425 [Ornithinibacter sp.]
MELPQHWVTAEGFSPHLGSGGGMLTVWGWSSQSETEAARVADERLAQALERVAREGGLPPGHGYYPRMPLREPVLEEVEAASGAVLGVVTRNRMGCEVLCTDLLFIADVDAPELEDATARGGASGDTGGSSAGGAAPRRWLGTGMGGFFRRLLSGDPAPTPMTPPDSADDDAGDAGDAVPAGPRLGETSVAECLACEPLWEFARRHPELGVRVYRTAAGFRVLVTGVGAPPASARARVLLTELGSDPVYVELCASHDSYRARLTPKPFRVGARALPVSWPFADVDARGRYEEWVSQYDGRSSGHAVCRLVSVSGPEPGPGEARLVRLHDTRCRVGERLPLA